MGDVNTPPSAPEPMLKRNGNHGNCKCKKTGVARPTQHHGRRGETWTPPGNKTVAFNSKKFRETKQQKGGGGEANTIILTWLKNVPLKIKDLGLSLS